ncbi:DUF1120 domain-containing protein [Pseudomonas sp. 18175]|uniref:DUF1120 domain-containing protein n=1 Tax=Pseudomonas sp. 18175 TaxID=3390056 RepID=UPI003D1EB14D
MKKLLSLAAATLALVGVGQTLAASSVDLSIKGSITPAACTPMLANGGVVDHGKISAKDLVFNGNTVLPEALLPLSISCEAPTLVAVKSKDNRAGTSAEWEGALPNFGLGLAAGNVKIGWYTLKMINATVDNAPGRLIESVNGQAWFEAPDNTVWQPDWMRTVNGASSVDPVPQPLMVMRTDVVIATTITRARDLPLSEEILIDGSATLDIVYL